MRISDWSSDVCSSDLMLLPFLGALLLVLAVMALWWRDVIREAVVEKAHSVVTRIGFRYGMAMFILSEVMFFLAFFWAFFNAALFPTPATGFRWPPEGIEPIDAFDVPLLMTMILRSEEHTSELQSLM